jgi:predicted DNA-binding transcriptional regulator AlpA
MEPREVTNTLENLPADIARHRILNSAKAAEFWGVSTRHWRRLYQDKSVPAPIKLSARRLGWRVGDLIDALEQRSQQAAA